ncbi:hypothetical protein GOV08_01560 [Candidatus Woesearchaeota archaeon]|nr:hypothetical protein [Candidatus Woesearchaeota archaeon]
MLRPLFLIIARNNFDVSKFNPIYYAHGKVDESNLNEVVDKLNNHHFILKSLLEPSEITKFKIYTIPKDKNKTKRINQVINDISSLKGLTVENREDLCYCSSQ